MHPDDIVARFSSELKGHFTASRIQETAEGLDESKKRVRLWLSIDRDVFHRAVSLLKEFGPPHICTPMASKEYADTIELIYPFTMNYAAKPFGELVVILVVDIPRDDMRIRSVCDLVPGILYMERETMEMLGIIIEDIPDPRRLFTPDSLGDTYPMRD
ncbi:MAG: NADH-quinone oxidoreductase subunit C [Spirochaetota bacterium]